MYPEILAFGQVAMVDIALAGDNAVVVGTMAAALPATQRRTALVVGIGVAMVARILMSIGVVWILAVPGVLIVGGSLLFWIAWKMWRDMRREEDGAPSKGAPDTLDRAIFAIVVADLSMSLDNVLGVAGAADDHISALVFGLMLSVVLMGVIASVTASLINKHRWIGYVGLSLIVFVAARMLWHGVAVLNLSQLGIRS
jgi:YjbE family integral membrane protein